ncbi:MAG TPA: hypothetical protein VK783_02095 [Bacteroidia bacterium]|jgi:hypothetical protein|nr:hypothetical protein [Bacteroidia bacterium]
MCRKFVIVTTLVIFLSMFLSSCYVSRTTVGNGPKNKEDTTATYSRARQYYLFIGLATLNKAEPKKPDEPNYEIVSYMSLLDVAITGVTFGILSSRTTQVLVKKK